jgi:hypothetical protein
MTSTRERVSFPGIIRGQGQEAHCTVYATKVSLPGTSESAITDCDIQNVSKRLPDGNYQVTYAGRTDAVRYQGGNWLASV